MTMKLIPAGSPERNRLTPNRHGAMAWAVLMLLVATGCNTAPKPQTQRITEYQAEFQQLSAATQQQLSQGIIDRGQNLKAVYIALGKPDLITASPNGRVVNWIYTRYQPPQTVTEEKAAVAEVQRRNNFGGNPLLDVAESWLANAPRHGSQFDQNIAPRARGQSWSEYGKYLKDREMAGPGAGFIDRMQLEEYRESQYIAPAPDPATVKLEVIFIEELVSDAIVNDSYSAFVIQSPSP